VLWLELNCGSTLGWVRTLLLAHFLSQILTNAQVCWLVLVVLHELDLCRSEEQGAIGATA
jgi:hypothetical protein